MQQETCNRIGICQNVKRIEKISPRQDQSVCIPNLETVAISERIELEGFGFFQSLFCLVHFHATEDSQLHRNLPNGETRQENLAYTRGTALHIQSLSSHHL
jgi:hypothetical protein